MFINNTPRVIENNVTAEFLVGRSFVSVTCDVTTQKQRECKFDVR